jgi:hypothetical protein
LRATLPLLALLLPACAAWQARHAIDVDAERCFVTPGGVEVSAEREPDDGWVRAGIGNDNCPAQGQIVAELKGLQSITRVVILSDRTEILVGERRVPWVREDTVIFGHWWSVDRAIAAERVRAPPWMYMETPHQACLAERGAQLSCQRAETDLYYKCFVYGATTLDDLVCRLKAATNRP